MKKITFLLVAISCIIFNTQAQVGTASIKLQEADFAAAKTAIDKVMDNPKQTAKGKTWYVYGEVYFNIFVAEPTLDEDALSKALTGFTKAIELGHKAKDEEFFDYFRKISTSAYLDNNWEMTIEAGQAAKQYSSGDTLVNMLLIEAANNAEKFDIYETAMEDLLQLEFTDKATYLALFGIYYKTRIDPPNDVKSLELLEQAVILNPSNEAVIQLMIMHNKLDEAITKLEEKLQTEPDNANYLYNLGAIYDKIENEEKALEYYQKALDVEPNNVNALFNLGALYNNKGALMIEEYNNQGLDADEKLKEDGTALLNQALPYFEKLYEMDELDNNVKKQVMTVMKDVYRFTGDTDSFMKIDKELGSME